MMPTVLKWTGFDWQEKEVTNLMPFQIPWLHMVYAAIGAIAFTMVRVSILPNIYSNLSYFVEWICSMFFRCVFMFVCACVFKLVSGLSHPAAHWQRKILNRPRGICFRCSLSLYWHYPDLHLHLANHRNCKKIEASSWLAGPFCHNGLVFMHYAKFFQSSHGLEHLLI